MSKPQRIQLRRTKGWRLPPNTVKVDRSTTWGNPFKVGDIDPGNGDVMTLETTIARFRQMVEQRPVEKDVIRELRGKNLACWCKPGAPCHADVLLQIANS